MKVSALSQRYAKALYELASENKNIDKVFFDLRELEKIMVGDHDIHEFLSNPMITSEDRTKVLKLALDGKGLSSEAHDMVMLLAEKHRFDVFHEMVRAFERQADATNNVVRGTVRSATVLPPEERQRIEKTVEKVLKKNVIMTYKVDPTVIGGLVAQAGSYTFDDSIASHLRRMNEELKRRTV